MSAPGIPHMSDIQKGLFVCMHVISTVSFISSSSIPKLLRNYKQVGEREGREMDKRRRRPVLLLKSRSSNQEDQTYLGRPRTIAQSFLGVKAPVHQPSTRAMRTRRLEEPSDYL